MLVALIGLVGMARGSEAEWREASGDRLDESRRFLASAFGFVSRRVAAPQGGHRAVVSRAVGAKHGEDVAGRA